MSTVKTPEVKLLLACSNCKRQFDATGFAPKSRFHCSCGETVEVPEFRSHDAAVVRCSSCSAPRNAGASSCRHCGADYTLHERDLHTVCPSCLTRVSDKARFCHHCATPIAPQGKVGQATEQLCPSCGIQYKLTSRKLGEPEVAILECSRCAGIWLGNEAFELVAERSRASTLPEDLLKETSAVAQASAPRSSGATLYRRCPVCRKHMNRRNYGKRSGVIIDNCKPHGIWFDATELGAILRWIRQGGEGSSSRKDAEESRQKERALGIRHTVLERAGSYGPQRRTDWDAESGGGLIGGLLGSLFDL
jgi:Zn-finger nucleic acid-binding protein